MAQHDEPKAAPAVVERQIDEHDLINTSGHVQELDRKFGILSVVGVSIQIDNAWGAGGGALVLALYNGGGPGVIWGLVAATFFYMLIGASLAELASAMPSSANVYHWASVTAGPRHGRVCSWFAGWWNCISWVFGTCTTMLMASEAIVAIYSLYHPAFEPQRWQMFICYLAICVIETLLLLFGQRILPFVMSFGGILCLLLMLATVLVCAIMPSMTGYGYASNSFVWGEWQNLTGWSSSGFVFLMGMINGAYAIGTPDGVCHLCEEIPKPRVNVPKGIAAQLITGFISAFVFYVAILYGTTSLDDVFNSTITSLPLAEMYRQATRSQAATTALLVIFIVNCLITAPGAFVTANRMLWTLGRDNATPFSRWVGKVHPRWRNPFNAQLVCSTVAVLLGCIYIGSDTVFNAFIGAFTIFTTLSYLAAILPHILTRRRYVVPGPFWMSNISAYLVTGTASAFIVVFDVIWMFPFSMPFSLQYMNWNSLMSGGLTLLLMLWYLWKRNHGYVGPSVVMNARDDIMIGYVGLDKALAKRREQAGN